MGDEQDAVVPEGPQTLDQPGPHVARERLLLMVVPEVVEAVLKDEVVNGGEAGGLRGGSGKLHSGAEWNFCLTAARMAADQER
jgi:hypothetical protein